MTQKRILILYAGYGEGHRQAANALAQSFNRLSNSIDVDVVDYMELVAPKINWLTMASYEKSVTYTPGLYGLFYRLTGKLYPGTRLHQSVGRLGINKLYDYIKRTNPIAVISTYPISAGAIAWLNERGLTKLLSATVITDHDVHSQWVHFGTDLYYVGSKRVKRLLDAYGVPENRIHITGIPVREEFHQQYHRETIRQAFGLQDRLTALIVGGWRGVLSPAICHQLIEQNTHVQFIFVCGGNELSYKKLLPLESHYFDRVKVLNYVKEMPKVMACADVVISKAGGLTTSEALAIGLPMILHRPIPGQETENAQYLVGEGVAKLAADERELLHVFHSLCADRALLEQMKRRVQSIKPKNVSQTICTSFLHQLEHFAIDDVPMSTSPVPYVSVPFEG